MDKQEILKLAKLARIDVSPKEADSLAVDMASILDYVGHVNSLSLPSSEEELGAVFNVMREDDSAHESGLYTEDMLQASPDREENYFKVKKIL